MKLWFATPICAVIIATGTAGCTRTPDGSIQPTYAPTLGRAGPVPVVTFEPVQRQASDTLRNRPAPVPEPPPEAFNPPPVYRAARRTAAPAQVEPLASTVTCGPMKAATGRVRVECR